MGGVPVEGAALLKWLQDGEYKMWKAESKKHDSTGPHFGGVLTFVNTTLDGSITASNSAHPKGSAAVKELYGTGDAVLGWAVWVKLDDDSAMGKNIYWYEYYKDNTLVDATGSASCTGCHARGVDYFMSPIPLQ